MNIDEGDRGALCNLCRAVFTEPVGDEPWLCDTCIEAKDKKKSKFQLWMEVIQKAEGKDKLNAVLFGWLIILLAHDDVPR